MSHLSYLLTIVVVLMLRAGERTSPLHCTFQSTQQRAGNSVPPPSCGRGKWSWWTCCIQKDPVLTMAVVTAGADQSTLALTELSVTWQWCEMVCKAEDHHSTAGLWCNIQISTNRWGTRRKQKPAGRYTSPNAQYGTAATPEIWIGKACVDRPLKLMFRQSFINDKTNKADYQGIWQKDNFLLS